MTLNEFLVFELDDSGEKKRLEVKEEKLQSILHPEQVLVIVKEDLRRIFIWKGSKSPVRKRFISSRVAQDLQTELQKDSKYHRCKIVSVDQGEEMEEFLSAFRLESMKVTEKLEDMYYVRNIERESVQESSLIDKTQQAVKKEEEALYYSPALQDTSNKPIISSIKTTPVKLKEKQVVKPSYMKETVSMSEEENKIVKEKILKTEVPENYERENLIIGHSLYSAVSKKAKVFGKDVEEIIWEPVRKFPSSVFELEEHKIRIHFDKEKGIVEAIEILKCKKSTQKVNENEPITKLNSESEAVKSEKETNFESWTIKDLKNYCTKNNIDTPASARKADILELIKVAQNKKDDKKSFSSLKRALPKIPSNKDPDLN